MEQLKLNLRFMIHQGVNMKWEWIVWVMSYPHQNIFHQLKRSDFVYDSDGDAQRELHVFLDSIGVK
jgi:hypothetical protein